MDENNEKISEFLYWIVKPFHHFFPSNLDVDEKRRRALVVVGAVLGIPVLIYFASQDFRCNDIIGVVMDIGLALLFIVSLVVIGHIERGIWLYRLLVSGLTAVLLANYFMGPSGESSLVWMFIYPLVTFYIFGIKEGVGWCGSIMVISIVTILFPGLFGTYNYPLEMRSRFTIAYVIVILLSLSFEFLRWHFYTQLEKQRLELKTTLEKVRTLDRLVPICSICKKIRDDEGYWNQVEEYLLKHTEVQLTHGICDDCYSEHYPEEYAKRKTKMISSISEILDADSSDSVK